MISVERYQKLQKAVENRQRRLDRAEGALGQLEGRLKDEFDCSSVEAAEKLVVKFEKRARAAEKTFTKSLESFEEEWDDAD